MDIDPCPFCGEEIHGDEVDFFDITVDGVQERRWFVACECGAQGPFAVNTIDDDAIRKAISLWNRRANTDDD